MRRSDREITDLDVICEGIEKCDTCRLGLVENGQAYIVPMSFGFERRENRLFFYFHSAGEGRKIGLMKKNQRVSFELDRAHLLVEGERACDYGMKYQCVMGTGSIVFLEGEEKLHGLHCLMKHYTDKKALEYSSATADKVLVFRLEAEEISCKEHK